MMTCWQVPKEDVFRFVTEALTLPEATGRTFSLCPSANTAGKLKEMRLCGYERRDEVKALLGGMVMDEEAEAAAAAPVTAEEAEEREALVLRSEAEVAAEREAELQMLLQRARQRGVEVQQKLKYEEEEKAAKRKEAEQYYKAPKTPGEEGGPLDGPVDIPDTPPKAPGV